MDHKEIEINGWPFWLFVALPCVLGYGALIRLFVDLFI